MQETKGATSSVDIVKVFESVLVGPTTPREARETLGEFARSAVLLLDAEGFEAATDFIHGALLFLDFLDNRDANSAAPSETEGE